MPKVMMMPSSSDPELGQAAKLSPPQAEILASGMLRSGFSCVLQMPTGSGKTWLAEQAITAVLEAGASAVYLTPLRALAAELGDRWREHFAPAKVGIFTSDYGVPGRPYPTTFQDAQLLVMTPERLDACTRFWRHHWSWIPKVDLLVVDEFHLLGEQRRSSRLEGGLSRFRRLNPFVQMLALSATLGNRRELADWLDGVEYVSDWRPVPLQWRIVRYRKATEKPELLATEIVRSRSAGGKSLVFVQSRRRAEELSHYLAGVGFHSRHHHAGLTHEERRSVESAFRQREIDALVSTATLEMGLNLPVRQVLLYDLQSFDGVDFCALSTNTVWQRVGRAGSPGLDREGEAVLFAAAWDRAATRYSAGHFEPIRSAFADRAALAEQVIAEVASGLCRSPSQLEAVFQHSLAGQQQSLPNPNSVLDTMCQAGMVCESSKNQEGDVPRRMKATRLGHIASRHLLNPETVLLFRQVIDAHRELSFLDLLILAASSEDCEPVLPVDFEELDGLASSLATERSILLRRPQGDICDTLRVRGKRLLASLKMAIVARAWTRLSDRAAVAEQYDCYPFEVERLRESFERLLSAMIAVATVPQQNDGDAPTPARDEVSLSERIRALHSMVASGLDESAATLALIHGIGPKLAKRLQGQGVADIEDLALADPGELEGVRGVSHERATKWIEAAATVVRSRSALAYREAGPTLDLGPPGWPSDVDPYRLRRALDLKISGTDGGTYLVTGGLEPHLVRIASNSFVCDCVDASRGHACKHVLSVKLHRGDLKLRKLVRQLNAGSCGDTLDLFNLWFDSQGARRVVG